HPPRRPAGQAGRRQDAMRRLGWVAALLLAIVAARCPAGEPAHAAPCDQYFLERVAPAGGWFPYGGGLLCWWDPDCSPRCGCPDDYHRKRLPCVCWPRCTPCCVVPAAAPAPPVHVTRKPPAAPERTPSPVVVPTPPVPVITVPAATPRS